MIIHSEKYPKQLSHFHWPNCLKNFTYFKIAIKSVISYFLKQKINREKIKS